MQLIESPAFERNIIPIMDVLNSVLPDEGLVLETASGPGQHLMAFAKNFPLLTWQGSDYRAESIYTIGSRIDKSELTNLVQPLELDLSKQSWTELVPDKEILSAILNINMSHIAAWECTDNLIAGAAKLLRPGSLLFFYGPWWQQGKAKAASNIAFDDSLKKRNPAWGVRGLESLISSLEGKFHMESVINMPANNMSVVCRRLLQVTE